jgi:hypothetical protein
LPWVQASQFGEKQKQAAAAGEELARRQGKSAHIGYRFDGGLRSLGPFLIQAARQGGKPFGFENFAHRGGTQGKLLFFEGLTDFINGVVLFTQRDDQGAGGGLFGLRAGSGARGDKETGMGVAEKGMAKDPESAGGITEGAGGFVGGASFDVVGPEGFVLTLFGVAGLPEKGGWVR